MKSIQYNIHKILQSKFNFLLPFCIMYLIFFTINGYNSILCMQSQDDYLHRELVKLMQENLSLKENVTRLEEQNDELRNIVRNFILNKQETQEEHENILRTLEFEKVETARQEELNNINNSRIISSLMENQQFLFNQANTLQSQLDTAQQEICDMAGNNMDLRYEAIEQQRKTDAEIKQLEQTINELSVDQSKRKKHK